MIVSLRDGTLQFCSRHEKEILTSDIEWDSKQTTRAQLLLLIEGHREIPDLIAKLRKLGLKDRAPANRAIKRLIKMGPLVADLLLDTIREDTTASMYWAAKALAEMKDDRAIISILELFSRIKEKESLVEDFSKIIVTYGRKVVKPLFDTYKDELAKMSQAETALALSVLAKAGVYDARVEELITKSGESSSKLLRLLALKNGPKLRRLAHEKRK